MGPWLSERLGQPVIIENRPGASTNIAAQAVVNSPPDGYTLLLLGRFFRRQREHVCHLPSTCSGISRRLPDSSTIPWCWSHIHRFRRRPFAELIAYAKANPGKVTMASFGTGSASHLAGELFKIMAGVNMVHVPYRGGAPMVIDLIGGQVQVGFDVMVTSLPHIRTGALRALAVAGQPI